ncbi:MAG: divalent cation tolerance protein CutA, partial [Planctomycetota bacterium]
MSEQSSLVVFITTVSDREAARTLARELLGLRVAACIQIDEAVESFYEWKGEVCHETECRLWI